MFAATAGFGDEFNGDSGAELRSSYTALFHKLDADESQKLSSAEARSSGLSRESFMHLDADNDSRISLEEFLVLSDLSGEAGSGEAGSTDESTRQVRAESDL